MLYRIAVPLLALAVAACAAPRFKADVTRFYVDDVHAFAGKRVTVKPARPDLEGLEFAEAAARLGEALGKLGFVPAGEGEPDWIADLDYSVTPLATESGSDARIGIGGGHFGRHVGLSGGLSLPLGKNGPDTVYSRRISLALVDAASGTRLWEGRAVSVGRVKDLGAVMPLLIEALLRDFPGRSGQTVEVELPVEEPRR